MNHYFEVNAKALISDNGHFIDFLEAYNMNYGNIIYMGKRKNSKFTNLSPDQLLISLLKNNSYLGKVLFPEGRGDYWSYEKNMAFFIGGILANKTFKLITPIDHYINQYLKKIPTCTFEEMIWLYDNGYEFKLNLDHSVTCIPTIKFKHVNEIKIKSFRIDNYYINAQKLSNDFDFILRKFFPPALYQLKLEEIKKTKNKLLIFRRIPSSNTIPKTIRKPKAISLYKHKKKVLN